jgi:hypothetical protein
MKLSEKKLAATQTVLLFGPPKSGKTELAGKLAEHFNLIWFDLENGWTTLSKLPHDWQDKIEVIAVPDTRTYPIAIETMMKVLKGAPVTICEEHGKVDCAICKKEGKATVRIALNEIGPDTIVVVDSLTQLTNSCIAFITKDKPIDYKLDYDDWGNLGKFMDFCLSHIQQASYNVVCITHESEVKMEDGKNKLVPTAGTTNFSRNTAKYFGHCVYVEVKNKKHVAASSTTYQNNLLTGSRTGASLENTDANLLRIFKPELFPAEEAPKAGNSSTQGAVASDKLAQLRAKMAGGAK